MQGHKPWRLLLAILNQSSNYYKEKLRASFSFVSYILYKTNFVKRKMSSTTVRRTLSKKLSKVEDLELLEIDDFKVISAQRMQSLKLDDHLNLSQPKNDLKSGSLAMESQVSAKTNVEDALTRQNPFLSKKLTFMRSQSSKQRISKKSCSDFNDQETLQEILDFRTTFRQQWKKQEDMELEGMKKIQASIKPNQLLQSI